MTNFSGLGPIQDVYRFDIAGNFAQRLAQLEQRITATAESFARLEASVDELQPRFAANRAALNRESRELEKLGTAASAAAPLIERIADADVTLAKAQNQLAREQNKLNINRAAEIALLRQRAAQENPTLLAARGEARALRTLSGALEDLEFRRSLANLAQQAGIQLSTDGKRVFDAEATAIERIAAAEQRRAISLALAARGRDERGNAVIRDIEGPRNRPAEPDDLSAASVVAKEQLRAQEKLLQAELRLTNRELIENTRRAKEADAEFRRLTSTGTSLQGVVNNLLFSFRRLVGVLAVFTVARQVVSGFNSMVAGAIQFNAQLEASRVGLVGLVAASADVRDATFGRLDAEQQIAAAQALAIDQQDKLRRATLVTASSFAELADAFNQSVAPGLQAGLDLDQIRELTVVISQAATGLGLSQNQLAEEVRSLVQGTINPRNTRIATALGITNEDIRQAKELGTLFTFLEGRFAAISKTGQQLMQTFTGQLANATDAFQQLLAITSRPLFEQLKASLVEIQKGIFTATEQSIAFNPEAVRIFSGLFEGLGEAVRAVRIAFSEVDTQGLADTFASLGQSIALGANLLATAFTSAINVAAPLATILRSTIASVNTIINLVKLIDTALLGTISNIGIFVAKAFALSVAFKAIRLIVVGPISAGIRGLISLMVRLGIVTQATTVTAQGLRAAFALLGTVSFTAFGKGLALVGLAIGAVDTALKFFGFDKGVFGLLNVIVDGLSSAFDNLLSSFSGVKEELAKPISDEPLAKLLSTARELRGELAEVSRELALEAKKAEISFQALNRARGASQEAQQLEQVFADAEAAIATDEKRRQLLTQITDLEAKSRLEREKGVASRSDLDALNRLSFQFQQRSIELLNEEESIVVELAKIRAGEGSQLGEQLRLQNRLQELEERKATNAALLERSVAAVNAAVAKQANSEDAVINLQAAKNDLLKEEVKLRGEIESKAFQAFRTSALTETFRKDLSNIGAVIDLSQAEESLRALAQGDQLRLAAARALADAQKVEFENLKSAVERRASIARSVERIALLQSRGTDAAKQALPLEEERLRALKTEDVLLSSIEESRLRAAKEEAAAARRRATGTSGEGFEQGLRTFAQANRSSFGLGEQVATDLANGLTSLVGNSVRAGLRQAFTGEDVNFNEIAQNFFIDFAASTIENLFKNLFANTLGKLLPDLLTAPLENVVDAAALEAALQNISSSVAAMAGSAVTASEAVSTALLLGARAIEAAGVAAAASISQAAAAAGITSTVSGAGSVAGSAKGGRVHPDGRIRPQGFARGGTPFPRPRGLDPRDTIPAWLRPREWVIRPEVVDAVGNGFFAALNAGEFDPKALRALTAAVRATGSPAGRVKRSFATGGQVQAGGAPVAMGGVGTVIAFNDEQTMDRALAAGRDSMVRFTRANRAHMRSALGLGGGS